MQTADEEVRHHVMVLRLTRQAARSAINRPPRRRRYCRLVGTCPCCHPSSLLAIFYDCISDVVTQFMQRKGPIKSAGIGQQAVRHRELASTAVIARINQQDASAINKRAIVDS
jgi:hypothetical protein